MDRRQFVVASGASAFAALAWLRSFGQSDALAASGTVQPTVQVALGVVQAILPFEDPRFPAIPPDVIRQRMFAIFSLDDDVSFASTLALFDATGAWADPPPQVIALESLRYGPPDLAHDRDLMQRSFAGGKVVEPRFVDLGIDDKRTYLAMWSQSALGVRRRVYQSLKALVHATAYSMDELWKAIGYEGPLVTRGSKP